MKYILIIGLWAASVTTAEFDDREACEQAARNFEEGARAKGRAYPVVWTCSPKKLK